MTRSDLAAVLIAGGMLVVLGSFLNWGACPQEPCDPELIGLMHIYERTGIDLGWGIVTAALGVAVLVLGVRELRGRGRRPLLERVVSLSILFLVGVHLYLATYGGPADMLSGSPYLGVYMTVIGAILALVASVSRPREARAPPI